MSTEFSGKKEIIIQSINRIPWKSVEKINWLVVFFLCISRWVCIEISFRLRFFEWPLWREIKGRTNDLNMMCALCDVVSFSRGCMQTINNWRACRGSLNSSRGNMKELNLWLKGNQSNVILSSSIGPVYDCVITYNFV